jgi:RNA recognition motif-containing protein
MDAAAEAPKTHSNLYVGNLTPQATEEQLQGFFATYGEVAQCRIVRRDDKTTGFVKMGSIEAAEKATAALNGQNGLIVKFANYDLGAKPKNSWGKGGYGKGGGGGGGWGKWKYWMPTPKLRPREDESTEKPEGPPSANLYVKHLPVGISEEDVKATFATAGEVTEVKLLRLDLSLEWGAIINMASAEQAAAARQSLDNKFPAITTQPVTAATQQKAGAPKEDHCYLKGIPTNTSKEKLEALFAKYGEVKWCTVMPGTSSWKVDSTASALVEMGSEEQCQAAIAALNEQVIPFGDLGQPLKVRYALVKEEKPAAVEAAAA